jgi:LPXTG-site transpeptidase (sortase) family protein
MVLGGLVGILFVLRDAPPQPKALVTPTAVVLATAPPEELAATVPPATEPATLLIPKAGVASQIIQIFLDGSSWDISLLGENVGHLQGTATFDQPGNIVLVGHVEMADGGQGVFAQLRNLAEEDLIVYRRGNDERLYRVRSVGIAAPDDLTVLYPTQSEQLTLITCDSYDLLTNSYLERLVVVADRV